MPLQMEDRDIQQCVKVKIELGHNASLRTKPTKEGFTHDWSVFVRAPEGSNIAHFVEKVVFHLPDTFPNPIRVVKKPPYHVSEVGCAGFRLPVEIYFKNKEEPQKIKFNYDLSLPLLDPVNYIWCEKLTFKNPADEFKKNLIKAGGVFVMPPGEAKSANLFGPPIKTKSPKKQKKPSTISSKEKVSKQMPNCSGDEKPSSSGKDISASLKSSAKQEKANNSSKDHDAASTSSSSSSTSKEKVQHIQSSREKHSSKDSNSSSKMVPNSSTLPSQQKPSESPIPSESNQKKAARSHVSSDKQRSQEKAEKDKVVKYKSSENKDESQRKSKDGKDSHKTDTSKQKSSNSSKEKKKESNLKDDKISKFDDKREAMDDKKGPRDNKQELMDEENKPIKVVMDHKKEVKDDKNVKHGKKEVKDGKKEIKDCIKDSKKEIINDKKEGENDKKEVKNDEKEVKDDRKVKEVKDDKKEVKAASVSSTSKSFQYQQKHQIYYLSDLKRLMAESENEDLYLSKDISTQSDDDFWGESSGSDLDMELDISQTSSANKSSYKIYFLSDLKILMTKSKNTYADDEDDITNTKNSSQPDDDILGKISGSDSHNDLDISPASSSSKTSKYFYSLSDLHKLMAVVEDISEDDEDDITDPVDVFSQHNLSANNSPLVDDKHNVEIKVNTDKGEMSPTCEHSSSKSSKGENDKKEKSSKRNKRSAITSDAKNSKPEHRKRSASPLSALDSSVAKKRRVSVKPLSKVTPMKLKEDLYLSSDSSSQSDDDFWGESSGSDSDMELYISPTSSSNNTSNHIYSLSDLKKLMAELEDISEDDDDGYFKYCERS